MVALAQRAPDATSIRWRSCECRRTTTCARRTSISRGWGARWRRSPIAGPKISPSLLLTPGIGARTLFALALVAEVIHGAPSRFADPARFSLAHGGKDGHPFPVPLRVYDETIAVLKRAVAAAKLGEGERLAAIARLDERARWIDDEASAAGGAARRLRALGRSREGREDHSRRANRRRRRARAAETEGEPAVAALRRLTAASFTGNANRAATGARGSPGDIQ